jgi:hypothetical protein
MVELHLESASELVGRRGLPANSSGVWKPRLPEITLYWTNKPSLTYYRILVKTILRYIVFW